jgi:DNA-binding response OmpR family regulator
MSASAVRILVVGPLEEATGEMSQRLERHGWATHAVMTLREAQIVLQTIRFPLVLAAEKLADGTGYELTKWATQQELTLMVGLKLTDTLLWLPVVEAGERSLGSRALNPIMLEAEIERLLWNLEAARALGTEETVFRGVSSGPVLKQDSSDCASRKKRASEGKTLMPPLRDTKKLTVPTPIDHATGTHGKHWRG